MYIKPLPIGTNPPVVEDRMPLWRVISGDDDTLTTRVYWSAEGVTPATPGNSVLRFVLAEDRFMKEPYFWEGVWHAGIEEVDSINHPGLVRIKIPGRVLDTLRRGAYTFALTVSTRHGTDTRTTMRGDLLMEYEPTSPQHSIPYKDPPHEDD
jgi:hypothetical protein